MNGLRPLEKQFEETTVQRIRGLIIRTGLIRETVPGGATRYYFAELGTALESGALLSALHLIATTLELFVRALIVERVSSVETANVPSAMSLTYQERLEENRLLFRHMVDKLVSAGLFSVEDAPLAKRYYEEVRTPLVHGLLERFIHGRPTENDNIARIFGRTGFTRSMLLEQAVEENALNHIEVALDLIERNIDYRTDVPELIK